jgi:hypothetical protein
VATHCYRLRIFSSSTILLSMSQRRSTSMACTEQACLILIIRVRPLPPQHLVSLCVVCCLVQEPFAEHFTVPGSAAGVRDTQMNKASCPSSAVLLSPPREHRNHPGVVFDDILGAASTPRVWFSSSEMGPESLHF